MSQHHHPTPAGPLAGARVVRSLALVWFAAAALVLAVLPATTAVLPSAAPLGAVAAAASSCDGVTVRVERGGSSTERCAAGAPRNGLFALAEAGFRYTEVPGQAGMVCSIEGYPRTCDGTPPVDAYWSYWHADAGATSWTYSNRGGANRTPAPGSHDAWVFGAGSPPSSPPPAPAPPSGGSGSDGSGSGSSGGSGSGSSGSSGSGGSGSGPGSGGSGSSGGSSGSNSGTASTSANGSGSGASAGGGDGDGASSAGSSGTSSDTPEEDPVDDADAANDTADDDPDTDPEGLDDSEAADDEDTADRDEDALLAERETPAASGPVTDPAGTDAAAGGGSAGAILLASVLLLGLGAAGFLRARRRGADVGFEA